MFIDYTEEGIFLYNKKKRIKNQSGKKKSQKWNIKVSLTGNSLVVFLAPRGRPQTSDPAAPG